MASPIKLIVGLGNPGPQYLNTRHNVGAWLVTALAEQHGSPFHTEAKFKSSITQLQNIEQNCWLLLPQTYMNCSGEAILACAKFYKVSPPEILVVHDELDFSPGTIRIKQGGGHGGHNGLRNIIAHLHSNQFLRLRIGIGKPHNNDATADYVLHPPAKSEQQNILTAIDNGLIIIPDLIAGDIDAATRKLHGNHHGI